jgi:hypothetical protein
VPFQPIVPSKSMSMRTISGGLGGCALGAIGMFILTAWVWIGMVMISMMISTSITSINGVVLMSIITSSELCSPTCMAMACSSYWLGGGSVMNPTLAMPAR